ncbi:hypothetical protein [Nocardioides sp. YIM 152588]|uniref:hypothetical protein n=1 Tax=Nocardioides sp. YIM 152588 TaxID=3158259 RepID=UPI0032E3DCF5
MRRTLAALQLIGFLVAGLAMVAPDPGRLVRDWAGSTIYPWWAAVYAVAGVAGAAALLLAPDRRWAPAVTAALVVPAAQLAGYGLVAVKHWKPAIGIGGNYAGKPDELAALAAVVAVAAAVATACALAQLVSWRAFTARPDPATALLLGCAGALVVVALPVGIAEGAPDLLDATSLGAFALAYSAPIGLWVAGAGWLRAPLRATAIGSCAAAAGLSALMIRPELSHHHGRPALLATALLLAALAALAARTTAQPGTPGQKRRRVGRNSLPTR